MKLHTTSMISHGQYYECGHCHRMPIFGHESCDNNEVYDGCIGRLSGNIINACCGHGDDSLAYIQYLDGSIIDGNKARLEQIKLSDVPHISRVSIEDLKLMWDEWVESASEDMETNKFHYEEIHAELNIRGEGGYCAV